MKRLPARILRRPAAAHLDRPRAGAESQADRRRRAGLRARRVDPGAGHQPDDGSAAREAALLPVHRARPRGRRAHQPPHRGHVSRQDRRIRRQEDAVHQPAAPLHRGAAVGGAGAEPEAEAREAPACRATCRARSTRRRAAPSTPAAPMPSTAARSTRRSWSRSAPATASPATCARTDANFIGLPASRRLGGPHAWLGESESPITTRASMDRGTSRPNAFAVLTLMTNSNLGWS